MQNEYMDNLTKLGQSLIKPITDLTELNSNTLNKLTKSESLENILHAKKPEDFISAQIKFINETSLNTIKHTQEACEIIMNAATDTGKIVEEIIRKTTVKSADMAQAGINKVKEKAQG